MSWLVKIILDVLINKVWAWVKPWIDKMAFIFQEKKIDDKNLQKLKDDQNGTDAQKTKDETDLLNGNNTNPK